MTPFGGGTRGRRHIIIDGVQYAFAISTPLSGARGRISSSPVVIKRATRKTYGRNRIGTPSARTETNQSIARSILPSAAKVGDLHKHDKDLGGYLEYLLTAHPRAFAMLLNQAWQLQRIVKEDRSMNGASARELLMTKLAAIGDGLPTAAETSASCGACLFRRLSAGRRQVSY
jgi:hypothetical protein